MVIFIGIHDVGTNGIYGRNCVPHSPSIPSLCAFNDYGCRLLKGEVEDLLPNCASLSQTNQSITPESTSSIIALREDDYEMEEEEQNSSQARGGKFLS